MSAEPIRLHDIVTPAFPFAKGNAAGELIIAGGSGSSVVPVSYDSALDAVEGVIRAAPCTLLEVHAYNSNQSDRYLMLFDLVAAPIDGSVPVLMPIHMKGQGHASLTYSEGRAFAVGCSWAISSTRLTLTRAAGCLTMNTQRRA